jgi:hypothetical protein
MATSKLNEWLQVLAALGVIAGLVLVAYELKQNTSVAQAEHSRETYLAWLEIAAIEMEGDLGSVVIKSYEEPDQLTSEDLYDLNAWLISIMSVYAYGNDASELGISVQFSVINEEYAQYLFGSRYARQWFDRNRSWLGPENEEVISRVIQNTPVLTSWPRFDEYYSHP